MSFHKSFKIFFRFQCVIGIPILIAIIPRNHWPQNIQWKQNWSLRVECWLRNLRFLLEKWKLSLFKTFCAMTSSEPTCFVCFFLRYNYGVLKSQILIEMLIFLTFRCSVVNLFCLRLMPIDFLELFFVEIAFLKFRKNDKKAGFVFAPQIHNIFGELVSRWWVEGELMASRWWVVVSCGESWECNNFQKFCLITLLCVFNFCLKC